VAGLILAAQPIGRVVSSEPFELRGVKMPAAGVSNWPIAAGDEIRATSAPAQIFFRDGSQVTLEKGARAKVEAASSAPVFRLVSGGASYKLAAQPQLVIYDQQKAVSAPAGSQGVIGTAVMGRRLYSPMVDSGPGVPAGAVTVISGEAPPPPPPAGGTAPTPPAKKRK
jgi:hypothetical protein